MKHRLVFAITGVALSTFGMAISAAGATSAAPFWSAICRGDKDANYTQTVGADGVFNQGMGDGTYQSWPLKQTFYNGKIVCGAVASPDRLAQVCADNERQILFFKMRDPKKPKGLLQDAFYCKALVKIH